MEELFDWIDAILDQGLRNEIEVKVSKKPDGWFEIVVKDDYSEIASTEAVFLDKALWEIGEQIRDFVSDLSNG